MHRATWLLLVAVLLAGCGRGERESILAKGARFPDDEGVVTDVNFERIQLDDKRAYPISRDVESFTTRGHDVTPLLRWKDRYVHIGLENGKVIWIAGIGVVAKTDPPAVFYSGIFEGMKKGRALFKDGTALKLAAGVSLSSKGKDVVVTIDPAKHVVVEVTDQS